MKRLLLALCFLPLLALAQTPDCPLQSFTLTADGNVGGSAGYFLNIAPSCQTWTVTYQGNGGLTGYTLAFQSATGTLNPGSFSTVTPVGTSASFGTARYGVATYNLISSTAGSSTPAPFVRVNLTGSSGTGFIQIQMYGYKTGPTGGTGGGGGGGGGGSGCPNPCPVEGVDASGSTSTSNPVQVAGNDGTDVRTLHTDAAGNPYVIVIGATSFTSGQQSVTMSAANLGSHAAKAVCVHGLIGNALNIYAGASGVTTSTGMEIPPGQGYCWNVSNSNLIYVIATGTGSGVSWTVTN